MKLEVGMYVRHKPLLSSKYVKINKIKEIEEKENCLYIWLEDKDLITEKYLIKASYNIIDLIEVGDYVDGEQVRYIEEGTDYRVLAIDEDYTYIIAGYDCDGFTKPIKSIVTKEMYSSVEYRMEIN